MTTDSVAAIGPSIQTFSLGRNLNGIPLVFYPIVTQSHPSPFELGGGHTMSVIGHHQYVLFRHRDSNIDGQSSGIPCVGDQLRQSESGSCAIRPSVLMR